MAPRESVTDTTIGSSSGVSPTASATANRKASSSGRCRITLTSSTNSTSSRVIRMIIMPKRCMPISNAVGGGSAWRLLATSPSAVCEPVAMTPTRALPLITVLPMNTALSASCSSAARPPGAPGCFSTG